MKAAASSGTRATVQDPVCGMEVDPDQAREAKRTFEYQGRIYYFCSDDYRRNFVQSPERR